MNETLKHILDNNLGLVNIILTGVFLPLGILWLTNRNNRLLLRRAVIPAKKRTSLHGFILVLRTGYLLFCAVSGT
jgi:hypothetical protein